MITENGRSLRILTNHWGQKTSSTWNSVSTYVPPQGNGFLASMRTAERLYLKRREFDCVVLGAGKSDLLFALIQSLMPFKKKLCIMIDCLWYKKSSNIGQFFSKLIRKIASRGVTTFIVWASREIDAYSKAFDIPREKFIFAPYHTTLDTLDIEPREGDYIFSGGNFGRDYETFIESVKDLPVKVNIASTRPELFSHIAIPGNVDVRGYSHEDFIRKMAGCYMNVVCLDASALHSGGQQTFLNSMWLGKPTIVTDPEGAVDYIRSGEDGLLVKPNDSTALRKAIVCLLENPDKAKDMGVKARHKARNFSTESHFIKIVSIIQEIVERKRSE